ncbi:hypothetical protein GCM10009813_02910 [Brevibacterium marinum]
MTKNLFLCAGSSVWLGSGVEHAVTTLNTSIMLGPRLSSHTEPPEGAHVLEQSPAVHEIALIILASAPASEPERLPFRTALDTELNALVIDDFAIPEPRHQMVRAVVRDPVAILSTVNALADRFAVSRRHLERIVKDDLGISFLGWRTRRRLNLALLRVRSGSTVSSAARSVGYDSADGLIKAACRMTGLPRQRLSEDFAGSIRAWATSAAQGPSGSEAVPSCTL